MIGKFLGGNRGNYSGFLRKFQKTVHDLNEAACCIAHSKVGKFENTSMSAASFLAETQQFFHDQIPLSKAMGVVVESFDEGRLVLTAPLAPNHNHLGTAFGGSLSVMTTLAGYGLLWLQLDDKSAHIVIRKSSIKYKRPVRGELRAVCESPDEARFAAFKAQFERKGKARIKLQVRIVEDDQDCVEFEGEFVAIA